MATLTLLDGLENVDWDSKPQPEWNERGAVPAAIRALAAATQASRLEENHRLLHALGNDHAGTYFPVVLAAIPWIAAIARDGQDGAREQALEVLIDLTGSFWPDPENRTAMTPDGPRPLRALVREAIAWLRPMVERRCTEAPGETERRSAVELLDNIDHPREPDPSV